MYVKVESFNPLASFEDRLALNIIETAETEGRLQRSQTVVEGNLRKHWYWACYAGSPPKGYP